MSDTPTTDPRPAGFRARLAGLVREIDRRFTTQVANGDRRYARALKWAIGLHIFVIFLSLLPALWALFHHVPPYKPPAGGKVEAKPIKRVQVKKKPRILHNPRSEIAFNFPDVLDVDLRLDKITENAYTGKIGVGAGKGAGAGYGGGAGGAMRFIRLKYDGGDWDQDMGTNSDTNMLVEFARRTGMKTAERSEYVTPRDLARMPRNGSPPFLYVTGERGIVLNEAEIKILREYLTERGGMLFADNGGGSFHSAFLNLARRLMPQLPVTEIPFDDEIFQQPYVLPGAPPLWHHSGYRALGVRYQGRWVIFYHQGDMGDAWKDGHSGAPQSVWEAAFEMGVNVMDYAGRNHYKIHNPDTK